jgi:hypothetical protein
LNTLRPAEETWVDQGKDDEINIHLDGTRLVLLVPSLLLQLMMDDVLLRHSVVNWQMVLGSSNYAIHEQKM